MRPALTLPSLGSLAKAVHFRSENEKPRPMPENSTPDAPNAPLKIAIEELLPDVYYPSESDEPIEFIELNLPPEAEPLNERSAGEFLATKRNREVEALTVDDFFAPLTEEEDWYTEEERETVKRMKQVRELLESHLTDLKVFKIGYAEKDLYLLGLTKDGQRVGLKTNVTETGDSEDE